MDYTLIEQTFVSEESNAPWREINETEIQAPNFDIPKLRGIGHDQHPEDGTHHVSMVIHDGGLKVNAKNQDVKK